MCENHCFENWVKFFLQIFKTMFGSIKDEKKKKKKTKLGFKNHFKTKTHKLKKI